MADTVHRGQDELLYVKASTPGAGSESDLRLPGNYTVVGLVQTSGLDLSRNLIPANHKDSGDDPTYVVGRWEGTHAITVVRPKDDNAGQAIIRDSGFVSRTKLYFLRVASTAERAVHYRGYIEGYNEGDDDDALGSGGFTVRIDGAITFFLRNT